MITKSEEITLENIGNGAAVELFRREWERITQNMFDPSTEVKTKRSLSIIIEAIPHESRQAASVRITHKTVLAPLAPVETSVVMGRGVKGIEID